MNNGDVSADFTLERFVGQLEVKTTDAIPAGTDHIKVIVHNELYDYYFDVDDLSGPPCSNTHYVPIKTEDIGSPFSKKVYVFRSGGPVVNVVLMAVDTFGEVITIRRRNNVEIQRNQKTTLTSSDFF